MGGHRGGGDEKRVEASVYADLYMNECLIHTFTMSISSLGSWTGKKKASLHSGDLERAHTFTRSRPSLIYIYIYIRIYIMIIN